MTSVADVIAERVVSWIEPGQVVNLGIGIPTRVADHLPPGRNALLQTENGMLGVGPAPSPEEVDPELVNAGKLPVSETVGASYFSSAESFAMIRGGHVDVAVLGALEVDASGRVANWALPGRPILGVGGAMDLMVGAARVIVATTHVAKSGEPKIVAECSLPITADRAVDLIVTEAGTFRVTQKGLVLVEVSPTHDLDWISDHTATEFEVEPTLKPSSAHTASGGRGS